MAWQAEAQDPTASASADAPKSLGPWLWDLCREPGVLEVLLGLALAGVVLWFWLRVRALVRGSRARQLLQDYLLGVEQAQHGDLDGAYARLQQVVQRDPENHYARLLLGKVLAERGEPEAAHQQHVTLRSAFGIDTAENDLALAQSLLAAGLPQEAAAAAERALEHGAGPSADEFVYRASLQGGDLAAAATAGKRLLAQCEDGPQRQRLQQDVARTLAAAGSERLRLGDGRGADVLLVEAQHLAPDGDAVRLLAARLLAHDRGAAAATQVLLANEPVPRELVDSQRAGRELPNRSLARGEDPRSRALVPAAAPLALASRLPGPSLFGLVPAERFRCRACGQPLPTAQVECQRCGCQNPAELLEPHLVAELPSPTATMDAIDANEAHINRLVAAVEAGGDGAAAARDELVALRARAVTGVLRGASQRHGEAQERLVEVLRAMGPGIVPDLFAASDALEQARLLPIGGRSPAALVGKVVQGFDRAALPHFQSLFASAKAEHRKILIDYFIGLCDLQDFQLVLERFPPLEILHRLNKAEAPMLRRFLQVVDRGHFLATSLLLEAAFDRDADLLAAAPGAADPEVLIGVLQKRGPSRTVHKVLLDALDDPALAATAERVLVELGPGAHEHVLAAFTDPEQGVTERAVLHRVLVRGGAAAAVHVADSFGPEPTALDDALRAVLVGIGDAALPPLLAAYEHSGWLEKVAIGFLSRHTNRRVQVVLALKAIGTPAARAVLEGLLVGERDANLRLRLQQALHRGPAASTGGDDGPR